MLWHLESALLSDTTFCANDQVAKLCRPMRKQPRDVERFVFGGPGAVCIGESIDRRDACLVLELPHGTWRVE